MLAMCVLHVLFVVFSGEEREKIMSDILHRLAEKKSRLVTWPVSHVACTLHEHVASDGSKVGTVRCFNRPAGCGWVL